MKYFLVVLLVFVHAIANTQNRSDANVFGHVVADNEHVAFANIMIKGSTIGTSTDETGHYLLVNLPEGTHIVRAQALGYKSVEKTITLVAGQTIELDFELESDVFGLSEVVITGDRNERNRRASTIPVSTLTPKILEAAAGITVSDGLNFSPGLRMENNCQNCGFNQIRLNGLEGPYTQILINGRQIFSGLMSVYGLELIPVNMIERIEIVRGGGSALYGSNAIGGTVNMILKDPIRNTYEFSVNSGLIGLDFRNFQKLAPDNNVKINASIVSSDSRTGLSLYGFNRIRSYYDDDGDGYSEMTQLRNTTIGTRIFHRPNNISKITFDYFNIYEHRRGGNSFELPYHEADIAEALVHNVNTASISYDRYFRGKDILSVFSSAQYVLRDSYYGAEKSLSDYGKTDDLSYNFGAQYTFVWKGNNLIAGIESSGNKLKDLKLGYPDFENAVIVDNEIVEIPNVGNTIIANQNLFIVGAFAQFEQSINKFKFSLGSRFDNYSIVSSNLESDVNSAFVFVPRTNLLYDFSDKLQVRASYGKAYRAPQIFDEDLHVEISGSRRVIFMNHPDLKQETSHSFTGSFDYNNKILGADYNIVFESFYTILQNAFANEFGEPDESGTVVYTRINSDNGAVVRGINIELNLIPSPKLRLSSGITLQQSFYLDVHEFDETRFFRTPNDYGFFSLDFSPSKKLV